MKRPGLAVIVCVALLSASGCGNKSDQQARLDEMQKKLDETQKKLEEAQAKDSPAPADAPGRKPAAAREDAPAPNQPPEAPIRKAVTIPAGTAIRVRTTTALSTKTATEGMAFQASLAEPLVVGGRTLAPKGANVTGVVTSADSGGRVKGTARLGVALRSVELSGGKRLAIETSTLTQAAQSTKKKDALKIGIGSGVGAAIGAIAGGGSGAAIGAGAGAAGGTGLVLATKGAAAELPAESLLTFKLRDAVTVP